MASLKLSMIARGLSTSPAASQMVKAPIQVFGIEGRYAHALYSAASKSKQTDIVEKELSSFQQSCIKDKNLRELILNPTIKRDVKSDSLSRVSNAAKFSSCTSNFLQLLAENGRLRKLDQMIQAYRTIMAAVRGEVTCEVTTATSLKPDQQQKLEAVLKKFVKANEKIMITSKVDPAILGGMLVSIGDKYVDMSIASKIKKYNDIISSAV